MSRPERAIFVGTSGFSYPSWRGAFYPEDLPARAMLSFYAQAFSTVEINNTFYRMPSATLLTGWVSQVPDGFRFALKAPQRITHHLRLRDAADPTTRFCTLATELGPKRGPLLFQLPPNLRADHPRLDAFLAALPSGIEASVEFRHASWLTEETFSLLRARGVALCVADTEEQSTPAVATAPFGYLRLRREDYSAAALDAWAEQVRDASGWERVYVYFKHDDAGRAAALANAFLARLR